MAIRTSYTAGDPCWVDLMAPDMDAARRFYGEVLGWDAGEQNEEYGNYMMFFRNSQPVAGAMPAPAGNEEMSMWTVYLSVPDASASLARSQAHGATVLVEPQVIGDLGTMALICDPAGAAIGLWQPHQFTGFGLYNESGAPTWFEHHSRNFATAVPFYRDVFSWDIRSMSDSDDFRYSTVHHDEEQFAGLMDSASFLSEGDRAHWAIYFGVDNVDMACGLVEQFGGRINDAPQDTPYGRLATVSDMRGATMRLMQS